MILLYLWMIEACVYRQNEIITAGKKNRKKTNYRTLYSNEDES